MLLPGLFLGVLSHGNCIVRISYLYKTLNISVSAAIQFSLKVIRSFNRPTHSLLQSNMKFTLPVIASLVATSTALFDKNQRRLPLTTPL